MITVPLEQISPNPYQTREREDPEHVRKIALSIAQKGLLQVPIARQVNGHYELAFGHTRLAAYKWLYDLRANSNIEGDYSQMPLEIRELTDLEMFELAVRENNDRKDLTPIETAKAMQIYRDQFGKTSAEIGELFNLSDSAVRNKIRLLGLPDQVAEAVGDGRINEGAARVLLTFYALPEKIQEKWIDADRRSQNFYSKKDFLTQALAGEIGSIEITTRLDAVKGTMAEDLSAAWWKYDDVLQSNDVQSLNCRECSLRSGNTCLDRACFFEKKRIYKHNYLYKASTAAGMPELEEDRWAGYGSYTKIIESYAWNKEKSEEKAKTIISSGCENLRVMFDDEKQPSEDAVHCVPGFPRAMIVCRSRNGFCRCTTGYEAMSKEEQAPEMSAAELKQAAADQLKAKKEHNKTAIALQQLAGEILGNAAVAQNRVALICLVTMNSANYPYPEWDKELDQVLQEKAAKFFNNNLEYLSLEGVVASINRIMTACGLPELNPEDAGKTAAEVMSRASQVEEIFSVQF